MLVYNSAITLVYITLKLFPNGKRSAIYTDVWDNYYQLCALIGWCGTEVQNGKHTICIIEERETMNKSFMSTGGCVKNALLPFGELD